MRTSPFGHSDSKFLPHSHRHDGRNVRFLLSPLESQWPFIPPCCHSIPGDSHSGVRAFTMLEGVPPGPILRPFFRLRRASIRSRQSTGTATSARLPASFPRQFSSQSDTAPSPLGAASSLVSLNSSWPSSAGGRA
ncbi:hypothetical protein AOQ84DRAFT_49581 [Glonium stellatum]|uniref:Uncharacterized protein n=1 Tax=Glonium stellatum TaxID=574774 RepID=A0A8E2F0R3_9PEZI|nr:hypothetical protein AOQ84DRAFT_49581 [Glonium stellatum]